jgi:hypothetical protein
LDRTELVKVLIKTNTASLQPIKEDVLRDILALVIQYPLDDDRQKCQEEIRKVMAKQPPGCIPTCE